MNSENLQKRPFPSPSQTYHAQKQPISAPNGITQTFFRQWFDYYIGNKKRVLID
ncbi:MAG TPA: hypothetical protein VLL52_03615 [Anaerolineae bacterium]|nr:hypothetical protein [Anaerolineae bacterium]